MHASLFLLMLGCSMDFLAPAGDAIGDRREPAPGAGTPAELRGFTPDELVLPTAHTIGTMNAYSKADGWLYRSGEACTIRRMGSIHRAEPEERVDCPETMRHPAWATCEGGMITRDDDGTCRCHTMSPADGRPPRVIATHPSSCPDPELAPEQITVPPTTAVGRLNPHSSRHGLIYRDRDGSCVVRTPLPPGTMSPSGSHLRPRSVPCPEGMFTGCIRGVLSRLDSGFCTCDPVEGDPPVQGVPGPCP